MEYGLLFWKLRYIEHAGNAAACVCARATSLARQGDSDILPIV